MDSIEDYVKDSMEGLFVVTETLLAALCDSGHLPREKFCRTLEDKLSEMPEDEAYGDKGAVIERVLDVLSAAAAEGRQKVTSLYGDQASQNDGSLPCSSFLKSA